MNTALLMLMAWAVEASFGWPDSIYKYIKHPVVWMGTLVSVMESRFNQMQFSHIARYCFGIFTAITVISITVMITIGIQRLLPDTLFGYVLEALIASSLIASRSLYTHVRAVLQPLQSSDITKARTAISHIVGRNPQQLDEAAITRAALETLAENASDAVIAPLFWGALFGLPGLAAYKAVNTLDSMIGHRTIRYKAFGGFAARLDDIANLLPARLTGILFVLASAHMAGGHMAAFKIMLRDAGKHRSPNAGWPESAMAGALGIRLSGPRQYENGLNEEPWLNAAMLDPTPAHLSKGLRLYVRMNGIACLVLIMVAIGKYIL